jgi:hypothetical protein
LAYFRLFGKISFHHPNIPWLPALFRLFRD